MKLYVIGLGPGNPDTLTSQAKKALQACGTIVGYTVYVDLIRPHFPHKEWISTPMRQEVDRCRAAIEAALSGKDVAVVCSGDAGVYGMAGLILELLESYPAEQVCRLETQVIPGITAACGGAAVLGAPLMHDFAVISLSDLLTPWEQIAQRLALAAQGDFVICLYNPASKKRADYLQKACDIVLQYQPGETVCGLVRHIGREGESARILSLSALRDTPADMFTTVYIGNRQTRKIHQWMVTPRGYQIPGRKEEAH